MSCSPCGKQFSQRNSNLLILSVLAFVAFETFSDVFANGLVCFRYFSFTRGRASWPYPWVLEHTLCSLPVDCRFLVALDVQLPEQMFDDNNQRFKARLRLNTVLITNVCACMLCFNREVRHQ